MVGKNPVQRSVISKLGFGWLLLAWWAGSGCSITKYVQNKAADVVAHSGTTFASDDDPELIQAAAPFSLKLMESLLAENPRHVGLLTATASGFTQFSYAFVQQPADEIEPENFAAAEKMRARARRLYLRAQRYGLRGLEVEHPGFQADLLAHPKSAVQAATKADVPLLYWTAAAWGSAISLSKDDPDLVGQIPAVEALIYRALALDESYGEGAHPQFSHYLRDEPARGRRRSRGPLPRAFPQGGQPVAHEQRRAVRRVRRGGHHPEAGCESV